jgi:2-polyprenyl-3-methyl-5-hydroxy-6-metoxy-1,4-benzoquinol methylase
VLTHKETGKMIHSLKNIFNRSRFVFKWRYFRGQTPWDTQVTPPEVMEFIRKTSPGKALDLGCGTGTNAITLASHGWKATGIDFVPKAIRTARRKAAKAGLDIDFYVADVAKLDMLTDSFDYALDIGCLFTLAEESRIKYAETLAGLLKPGACFMLYAWLPRPWKNKVWGITPEAVESLLHPAFLKTRVVLGEEKGQGSAWYWYERK